MKSSDLIDEAHDFNGLTVNTHVLDGLAEPLQTLIENHLSMVLKANETTNLTRITSDALILHVEDSLSAIPEMEAAPPGVYGDLGSGGGYPGIPLAIATGRETVLIESVQKKANILDHIIREIGLESQVSIYSDRIESLSVAKPASFNVLTARALSSLPSLIELASPLLALQGHLLCFKSKIKDEELDEALSLGKIIGMALKSDRCFLLSDEKTVRRIIVFEKMEESAIKLPRRTGMAQKRPMSI